MGKMQRKIQRTIQENNNKNSPVYSASKTHIYRNRDEVITQKRTGKKVRKSKYPPVDHNTMFGKDE